MAQILSTREDLNAPSNRPTLTVVTNAINIAAQLAVRPHIKIMVTGGILNPRSYELVGPYTDVIMQKVALDIAFIGVNAAVLGDALAETRPSVTAEQLRRFEEWSQAASRA